MSHHSSFITYRKDGGGGGGGRMCAIIKCKETPHRSADRDGTDPCNLFKSIEVLSVQQTNKFLLL